MFWALLATGIMLLTGSGDDAYLQKKLLSSLEEAITEVVSDPERRERALENTRGFRQLLLDHRESLGEVGDCVERLDRTYSVQEKEYLDCISDVETRWAETEKEFERLSAEQKTVMTPVEMEAVTKIVMKELQ